MQTLILRNMKIIDSGSASTSPRQNISLLDKTPGNSLPLGQYVVSRTNNGLDVKVCALYCTFIFSFLGDILIAQVGFRGLLLLSEHVQQQLVTYNSILTFEFEFCTHDIGPTSEFYRYIPSSFGSEGLIVCSSE